MLRRLDGPIVAAALSAQKLSSIKRSGAADCCYYYTTPKSRVQVDTSPAAAATPCRDQRRRVQNGGADELNHSFSPQRHTLCEIKRFFPNCALRCVAVPPNINCDGQHSVSSVSRSGSSFSLLPSLTANCKCVPISTLRPILLQPYLLLSESLRIPHGHIEVADQDVATRYSKCCGASKPATSHTSSVNSTFRRIHGSAHLTMPLTFFSHFCQNTVANRRWLTKQLKQLGRSITPNLMAGQAKRSVAIQWLFPLLFFSSNCSSCLQFVDPLESQQQHIECRLHDTDAVTEQATTSRHAGGVMGLADGGGKEKQTCGGGMAGSDCIALFPDVYNDDGDTECAETASGGVDENLDALELDLTNSTQQTIISTFFSGIYYFLRSVIRHCVLVCRITFRITSCGIISIPLVFLGCLSAATSAKIVTEFAWLYFFWAVEQGGACCIKFVQWASTRYDIFSLEFCKRLSKFHSSAPLHSLSETENILAKEFGEAWTDRIKIDDTTPVGSGCVAQVYKGRFIYKKDDETFIPVALKIAHPRIEENMKLDLLIMRYAAKMLSRLPFSDYVPFTDIVAQFTALMKRQLDFVIEAANMDAFRENFQNPALSKMLARYNGRILVPEVYFRSRHILIESFEPGRTLGDWLTFLNSTPQTAADMERIANNSTDTKSTTSCGNTVASSWMDFYNGLKRLSGRHRKRSNRCLGQINSATRTMDSKAEAVDRMKANVMKCSISAFMHMLFVDNFLHADLHPGNVIIRFPQRTTPTKPVYKEAASSSPNGASSSSDDVPADNVVMRDDRFTNRLLAYIRPSNAIRVRMGKKIAKRLTQIGSLIATVFKYDKQPEFEFVLLDCGLTTSLKPRDLRNFVDVFRCIATNNGYEAGSLMCRRARRQNCDNMDEFCTEVDRIVKRHHFESGGSFSLLDTSFADVLSTMLHVSLVHNVELDPVFVTVFLSLMIMEGVGRQLLPSIDMLRWARPFIIKTVATSARSLLSAQYVDSIRMRSRTAG